MSHDRLGWFNQLGDEEAVGVLLGVCHARAWAEQVAKQRPCPSVERLQAVADDVWLRLTPADWLEALDAHPRIGEQGGASADLSRREQAGLGQAGDDVRAAIELGNRAYEERFGHVFLIRAAGRSPGEMLAELRRRLANDADTERTEATEQLAQITALRVKGLVSDAKVTGERASPQAGGTSRLRGTATEERNESGAEPMG